jgi:ABC-type uncharacterized transport system substrate-binding protein
MKLFRIIICMSLYSASSAQSQDSVNVETVRITISEELMELRDSINQSLKKYDARSKAVRPVQKRNLQASRKELVHYYDLVELDLVEIRTTAQNGWTQDAISRIRNNMIMIRREHARLSELL